MSINTLYPIQLSLNKVTKSINFPWFINHCGRESWEHIRYSNRFRYECSKECEQCTAASFRIPEGQLLRHLHRKQQVEFHKDSFIKCFSKQYEEKLWLMIYCIWFINHNSFPVLCMPSLLISLVMLGHWGKCCKSVSIGFLQICIYPMNHFDFSNLICWINQKHWLFPIYYFIHKASVYNLYVYSRVCILWRPGHVSGSSYFLAWPLDT